ncbi:MAG: type II toxin-antitoxin system VapC family toxin [Solirubrobacteraceae bacterium]
MYFDTSALIKLVVVEAGAEIASALWAAPLRAASSILAYPEGCAAIAAARGAGRLSTPGHARARAEFESLHAELVIIGIDDQLARRAGALAEQFALRGYDAVHLASALALSTDTTVVSWDQDLRAAAAASGCPIAPA